MEAAFWFHYSSEGVARIGILRPASCRLPAAACFNRARHLTPFSSPPLSHLFLCSLIVGFSIKQSTAVSQAVIAASGIGSALYALTSHHPHFPGQVLVDLTLALVLTPALLFGMSLGATRFQFQKLQNGCYDVCGGISLQIFFTHFFSFLSALLSGILGNMMSPGWFIAVAIIIVLSYMSTRTYKTATRLQEAERHAAALVAMELPGGRPPPPIATDSAPKIAVYPAVPWRKLAELFGLWLAFGVLQLGKSRFNRCSWPYAGLYLAQLALCLTCTLWSVQQAVSHGTGSQETGREGLDVEEPLLGTGNGTGNGYRRVGEVDDDESEQWLPNDEYMGVVWTGRALVLTAAAAVGAGVVAGLIGLGG